MIVKTAKTVHQKVIRRVLLFDNMKPNATVLSPFLFIYGNMVLTSLSGVRKQ